MTTASSALRAAESLAVLALLLLLPLFRATRRQESTVEANTASMLLLVPIRKADTAPMTMTPTVLAVLAVPAV
jgi:hypothetical protein